LVDFFNRSTSLTVIGVSFFFSSSSVIGVVSAAAVVVGPASLVDGFAFVVGGAAVDAIDMNSK
jgi:hypothetical protein